MEILKKTAILLLLIFPVTVSAQNGNLLQQAFTKSYAYETAGKYDSAIVLIKGAYKADSYPCNLRLGWLYYLAGKQTESVSHYRVAAQLMPAAVEPLWGLVNPLAALEKWTDVEKNYAAILQLDPKNATANYRLGLIFYYRKDYVTAKKYFDVSLNLYPFDYDSVLMSAWTNYFLGKTSEARALFSNALLLKPGDSSAAEGLSLIK
ncbi:MAG: tetratricopeptide domain-containing protein [Bacteroidetes bacterium]|nr:MAG: tetratricopeptide domain-containing protein [Bacteroidota bacterium]